MPRRFRETLKQSFFGDYVYAQAIPSDHFLVQMDKVVPWDQFTQVLVEAYKGKGEFGAMPYDPVMILKMLLLSYLYNISERQTEEFCNYYLPAKAFVGLGITDRAPDHSTLTVFKVRLLKHKGAGDYSKLFDVIIRQAQAAGVQFGTIQVVDSVHTVANVNNEKDRKRIEGGKPSADPDATVVNKGTRTVTKADGTKRDEEVKYLGYKTHVSMDAQTGLVTSITPTFGDTADNKEMPSLFAHDAELGIPAETYAGDKGYDDGDLHDLLWTMHKHSALRLRSLRTAKKDPNKEIWIKLLASPFYQEGLKVRFRIERKFGEAKAWHGFDRCRYRSVERYRVQSFLTFMTLNLKRLVLLVTGTRFRPIAKELVESQGKSAPCAA
jgi:transposase, IS5 family